MIDKIWLCNWACITLRPRSSHPAQDGFPTCTTPVEYVSKPESTPKHALLSCESVMLLDKKGYPPTMSSVALPDVILSGTSCGYQFSALYYLSHSCWLALAYIPFASLSIEKATFHRIPLKIWPCTSWLRINTAGSPIDYRRSKKA